jgi:hypothetical protein
MFSATLKRVNNGYVVQIEKFDILTKTQDVNVFICKDLAEVFKTIEDFS